MTWIFFLSIFLLTVSVVVGAIHSHSWDNDGRLTSRGGLCDHVKFHLISRWGAHH